MTPVDEAYLRHVRMIKILERFGTRALANPLDQANIDLGLVERGEKPEVAKKQLELCIDQMNGREQRTALLEICAAFESRMMAVLATGIGNARSVIQRHYKLALLKDQARNFLRETESFGSLDSIFKLSRGHVSTALNQTLDRLKEDRNRSAHEIADAAVPLISPDEARSALNELLEIFGVT